MFAPREFEWDEAKEARNFAKHGFLFTDILGVFSDPARVDYRGVAARGRGISPQDRRPDRWPVLCCRLHLAWHRLSPDFGAKSERARKETLWASSDTALIRRILP